jgi:hypothetical protein
VSTSKKATQQEAKNKQLLLDIYGSNLAKRKTALEALQISGTSQVIKPLFELILVKGESENKDIIEFLSSLKQTNLKPEIIHCLLDPALIAIRPIILSCIWNMPLDFSEYLPTFVQLATAGDFMTTFECLTVLENLDGPYDEKLVLESQLILKEHLENRENEGSEKAHLISEIAIIIKDIDRSLDE